MATVGLGYRLIGNVIVCPSDHTVGRRTYGGCGFQVLGTIDRPASSSSRGIMIHLPVALYGIRRMVTDEVPVTIEFHRSKRGQALDGVDSEFEENRPESVGFALDGNLVGVQENCLMI